MMEPPMNSAQPEPELRQRLERLEQEVLLLRARVERLEPGRAAQPPPYPCPPRHPHQRLPSRS